MVEHQTLEHDVGFETTAATLSPLARHLKLPIKSTNEPPHGKTNNLHRRKQRRRSASQYLRS